MSSAAPARGPVAGRSWDFAPLSFLPPGKTAVSGIVTSKHTRLEPAGDRMAKLRRVVEVAEDVWG